MSKEMLSSIIRFAHSHDLMSCSFVEVYEAWQDAYCMSAIEDYIESYNY